MEAQMYTDQSITLRVFEYGFEHAMSSREDDWTLKFPEPVVIYLDSEKRPPKRSRLVLDFGKQGKFVYKIENFIYHDHDITEINQRKLILLIPFHLLKLRKTIQEHPTKENFEKLTRLIKEDILSSIEANRVFGNISKDDELQLLNLTNILFHHLYAEYEGQEGMENMKELLPGAYETDFDKLQKMISQKEQEISQKNEILEENARKIAQMERLNQLNQKLALAGRTEDIIRATEDEEYQKELLAEFLL